MRINSWQRYAKTTELLHEATQLLKTLRMPASNPKLKVTQLTVWIMRKKAWFSWTVVPHMPCVLPVILMSGRRHKELRWCRWNVQVEAGHQDLALRSNGNYGGWRTCTSCWSGGMVTIMRAERLRSQSRMAGLWSVQLTANGSCSGLGPSMCTSAERLPWSRRWWQILTWSTKVALNMRQEFPGQLGHIIESWRWSHTSTWWELKTLVQSFRGIDIEEGDFSRPRKSSFTFSLGLPPNTSNFASGHMAMPTLKSCVWTHAAAHRQTSMTRTSMTSCCRFVLQVVSGPFWEVLLAAH